MKAVILAGGFGTRIAEESHHRNRRKAYFVAYYEDFQRLRRDGFCHLLWV